MPKIPAVKEKPQAHKRSFHLEFLNPVQKIAWACFDQHDVLFLLGPAGVGKSHLAAAFAINEILSKSRKRIILTRPIVEAGESLGFLPGTFSEKVDPYMMPLYDCIDKLCGREGTQRDILNRCIEVAPIAYMRGRSQPLDAKVLTPGGYAFMGDLQVGDKVIGRDGKPTEVLDIYPQGDLEVFRVKFTDGTSVECSGDHLWSTMTLNQIRSGKYSVRTTQELAETVKDKWGRKVHRIPLVSPIDFPEQVTAIDPYVLGVILGDGNCHRGTCLTITNVQPDLLAQVVRRLPPGLYLRVTGKNSIQYRISGKRNQPNPLRREIAELGLLGKRSYEKWIPDSYLYNSIRNRLALLQGLLDTDGCVFKDRNGHSRVQFYTTSPKLAEGVRFLVHSLGGTATIRRREHDGETGGFGHCRPSYILEISLEMCPFLCQEKATKFQAMKPKRLVSAVERVGKKPCQCIRVAAEDSLYVTDHCIVTHNTFDHSVCIFDEAQNATKMQLKLFLTRFGVNSKIIVTGDPMQSDLRGDIALLDVVKRLEGLPGVGVVNFQADSIVRHPLIASILEKLEAEG